MADVQVFEQAHFQGRSQVLPKGRYDDALKQITIGNDTLSSLQVPKGLVVRLYEHFHFQGRCHRDPRKYPSNNTILE